MTRSYDRNKLHRFHRTGHWVPRTILKNLKSSCVLIHALFRRTAQKDILINECP